jgi:hypothetical protein
VLTLLLATLLALTGSLTGFSAAADSQHSTGGDRTAQAGRHADHDAVSGGSTRLTSSRVRAAVPRAQLHVDAAVLPTAPTPTTLLRGGSDPAARATEARAAPRVGTLSRAPPA